MDTTEGLQKKYPTALQRWQAIREHTDNRKYQLALRVLYEAPGMVGPFVWNIPQAKWIIWIGRNTAYKLLREAGWRFHPKYKIWTKHTYNKPLELFNEELPF